MNLCINTRDELHVIDLDNVAYMKANGNFTEFHFTDGNVRTHLPCLSDYERHICSLYGDAPHPFFRAGRSHLVNTALVASVFLRKRQLVFRSPSAQVLILPKEQLRLLKQYMSDCFL